MTIAASLLPEYDREMSSTRMMIELVTDRLASWRPHEKSWTTGELARHLANLPRWIRITVAETEFDLNSPEAKASPAFESAKTTLDTFDANRAAGRAAIEQTSDADMLGDWSLRHGDHTLFTMPRVAVLRSFVFNHMIHHRGQLSVCLRMQGVPLPEIYGPTADTKK